MERLSREDATYRLAISLHAPNDELRNELVPVNKNIGLEAILAAADHYFDVSGRRLTFEYVLLADLNDGAQHARELVQLLAGREALLNVIPYNPVAACRTARRAARASSSFAASWKRAGSACIPPSQGRSHRRGLRAVATVAVGAVGIASRAAVRRRQTFSTVRDVI